MLINLLHLVLLAAASNGDPLPVIILADNQVLAAASWSVGPAGELSIVESEAKTSRVIPSPALLDVDVKQQPDRPVPDDQTTVTVRLTSGEILHGQIQTGDSTDVIQLKTSDFAALSLAPNEIAAIQIGIGPSRTPANIDRLNPPCLLLSNGDIIPGTLQALTADSVTFNSDFGPVETELSRVAAIFPAPASPAGDKRKPGQILCQLTDGQRWHVDRLRGGDRKSQLRITRNQVETTIDAVRISQLVFADTRIRELISINPSRIETTPYLGEKVSVEIDNAGRRRSRAIGNRSFTSGMTARPRSRIVYELEPGAAFLIGYVGLDPVRGSTGICDVRIEANGQALTSAAGLTAQQGPIRIAVPLPGPGSISLVTDFGPQAELGDCVNWCNLTVIETAVTTTTTSPE